MRRILAPITRIGNPTTTQPTEIVEEEIGDEIKEELDEVREVSGER
jgi:hypothetical protein